ncbi:VOC family protein [uncultured Slackia sp.]|uniref:VOC family protein n=1 Tax=uncultured Slackia sp. TaxID=665903 RepID=UPI0026E04345|nr:VOC family protein [uncultured Slackia sp.]
MAKRIYHIGLTVFDMERSIRFYRDVLGLRFQGEILMQGPETDAMFQRKNCRARVAYLNGSERQDMPPVELIQFLDDETDRQAGDLFTTSISELCFHTEDAEETYRHLQEHGVECLSEPQTFDFTDAGFGKSKAFYFRDPDGIILEMMQPL